MLKTVLSLVLISFFSMHTNAQELISYTKISTHTKSDLKKDWKKNGMPTLIVNISNEFDLYELI